MALLFESILIGYLDYPSLTLLGFKKNKWYQCMKLKNKLLPCRKLGMVVRFSVQTMGKWELCFVQKMQVVFGAENGSYFWCIIWENGIGFWCINSSCFLVHKMKKWEISL